MSDAQWSTLRPEGASREEIEARKSPRGAWTAKTLAEWGVPWPPPHGWRAELERRHREGRGRSPETQARIARRELEVWRLRYGHLPELSGIVAAVNQQLGECC